MTTIFQYWASYLNKLGNQCLKQSVSDFQMKESTSERNFILFTGIEDFVRLRFLFYHSFISVHHFPLLHVGSVYQAVWRLHQPPCDGLVLSVPYLTGARRAAFLAAPQSPLT